MNVKLSRKVFFRIANLRSRKVSFHINLLRKELRELISFQMALSLKELRKRSRQVSVRHFLTVKINQRTFIGR